MLSDIEILDVMLGGHHSERDQCEISNGGRTESPSYATLLHQNSNSHPNCHETEIRTYTRNGRSSREADSGSEFTMLSGELNQEITRDMSDFMSTLRSQIQRAKIDAISVQILPQILATLKSGQEHMLERR